MSNEEHYATISMPTRFDVLIPDKNGEAPSGSLYVMEAGEYLIKGIQEDGRDKYLLIEDEDGVQWYVESRVVANPHVTAEADYHYRQMNAPRA
jgi:hypothetical protein